MAILGEGDNTSSSSSSKDDSGQIPLQELQPSGKKARDSSTSSDDPQLAVVSQELGQKELSYKPISNLDTMIHLLKGNIGTGIFAMPNAFLNSGIWVGSFLLPAMAMICTHCMQMLVSSAAEMKKREGDFSVSYADVAEAACRTGPKQFHKFAKPFRIIINVFICLTQFGFCCVYLVFSATNLQQVVDYYAPELDWDVRIYMCIMTVPLIFLNWIRNLKYLAPVSLISNLLHWTGIIVVFYYIFYDGLPPMSSVPGFACWAGLPLFFGTTVFTFEGIALVLPLQKEMHRPWDFPGLTGILDVGMVIVTVLYIAMGFYGYLNYGDTIMASITLNLPQEDVLAQLVKLFLVLSICGNYAMQFYVPIPIMWPGFLSRNMRKIIPNELSAELAFRTFMVLVTLVLSAAIPKIDLLISLIGALGSTFLALIFPPLLDLVTFWPNVSRLHLTKNVLILIFAAIGFATGSYAAIRDIVLAFGDEEVGHVCDGKSFF